MPDLQFSWRVMTFFGDQFVAGLILLVFLMQICCKNFFCFLKYIIA